MALAMTEALGTLDRDLEEVCPEWSSVACSSPGLSWAGETEAKTSREGGDWASGSASSWAWGRGLLVPVRDTLGYGELCGLREGVLVSLATACIDWGLGAWVVPGKVTGPSSKEGRL